MPPPGDQQESRGTSGIAGVLRNLGRLNRPQPATVTVTTSSHGGLRPGGLRPEYFGGLPDNNQLYAQLKLGASLNERIAAAECFRSIVVDYALSTVHVTDIWLAAQDLLDADYPPEARQTALKLMTVCIKHSEPGSLERLHLYRQIASHPCLDDFDDQLQALIALTNGGKNVASFEKDIMSLLSRWTIVLFREANDARQARKRDNGPTAALSAEEFNLSQLMKFMTAIIKFSHSAFEEQQVNTLLLDILSVCKKTTSKDDIKHSLNFIDALITYGYIPRSSLTSCVEVLCGAYTTIKDLADAIWNAVAHLCKSYMAHNTVLVLRDILEAPSKRTSRTNNTLRGAVMFLEKLVLANESDGLPLVHFSSVMRAFQTALDANNLRLEVDISRAIYSIFSSDSVMSQVLVEEWAVPLDILVSCSKRITERADGTRLEGIEAESPNSPMSRSSSSHSKDKAHLTAAISRSITQMINHLEIAYSTSRDFAQMEIIIDFFVRMYRHLQDSAAEMVINYYATEHLCYPSCPDWMSNTQTLLKKFFRTKARPSRLRISVLTLVRDIYETTKDVCDKDKLHNLVLSLFEDIKLERDWKVLDSLVRIAVDVAGDGNDTLFNKIIDILADFIPRKENTPEVTPISSSRPSRPSAASRASLAPSNSFSAVSQYGTSLNIITTGLVRIFIRNMHHSARKTIRAYQEIIKVAASHTADIDARLTAMRLLLRIRSDAEHAILLVDSTESERMAASLSRTHHTSDEKETVSTGFSSSKTEDESTSSSRSNRSNSVSQNLSLHRTASKNKMERLGSRPRVPLWTYPEKKPLPEYITQESSTVLFTYIDLPQAPANEQINEQVDIERYRPDHEALRMGLLLEQVVIPIIQAGANWEIYSYVLVNLASQLSNKTAFRNCKPHIKLLRAYICDQLHFNKIPNMDLPVEVKKADIAVALIHLLTTLICYHEHFARNEQEAIVKAFQLGLHSWQRTAKPCIHALSICCYELPMPTSKFLSGILTKLSQIITSSAVSVHILEFLSALARLPNLYANFTEPDFRNVFGIAFRYIQHSKENRNHPATRGNHPGRTGQREITLFEHSYSEHLELPQYVLALAYNVLTTWFLALRISERIKYIPWIIRGLVLGDGASNKDDVDEQSQACIDMLQRFTFWDVEATKSDPKQADLKSLPKTDPRIVTKSWLNGLSILTVSMDTPTGIANVTVRRPSGTSTFHVVPSHQDFKGPRADAVSFPIILENGDNQASALDKANQPMMLPSHILMQLVSDIGITSPNNRPILLPDDEMTNRAVEVFDRIPVVDFHKIGVVYVGAGQCEEQVILQNVMGSTDYTEFLDGMGNLIALKNANRNIGGLDSEFGSDGEFTYFWNDRTTEIIFHVTTMMPTNLEHDPQCTMKKRHIGNNFVTIVFNNSGIPYAFDTIPAQFSFVNIIISPEARAGFVTSRLKNYSDMEKNFYRVEVQCKPGIPPISPAAETKVISGKSLPAFVRNLALNASVFCHVYNEGGGEHISNWRHRLRNLNQLRDRITQAGNQPGTPASNSAPTSAGFASNSLMNAHSGYAGVNSRRTSAATTATDYSSKINGDGDPIQNEIEMILESFDFSRWS